jgi:hypothetical protein
VLVGAARDRKGEEEEVAVLEAVVGVEMRFRERRRR